jgi:tetratricopeptide (TPR) repeat protein
MTDLKQQLDSIRGLLQIKDLNRAKELCEFAISQHPENAEVRQLFAEVLGELGEVEESISNYRRSAELRPNDPRALNDLGIALARHGKLSDAITTFQSALRISRDCTQVHHNLGVAFAQINKLDQAEASLRLAVGLKPDYAEGFLSLANTLVTLNKLEDAIDSYKKSVRIRPTSAETLSSLGLVLIKTKRAPEAIVALRQATRLKPDFEGGFNNLGLALCEEGRYLDAESAFEAALRINLRSVDAHSNLGNLFKEQGRLNKALMCYDIALSLSPECISARWNRSLALLQSGDFENGWREYESRWLRGGGPCRRQMPTPEWDGSNLNHRTIFVYCEQGLGDVLQFVRYVSRLKDLGATIIVESPSPLMGILSTCRSIDHLMCEGEPVPDHDCHIPMMSLPRLVGTQLNSIPREIPYLFPDDNRIRYWRGVISQHRGFKIGIAWQGNPHHQWDRHRSIELARFSQLAEIEGVSLISLQRGPGTEQLTSRRFPLVVLLDPYVSDSDALLDTAAIMKSLDLIVTVDTATAHLAGAIGAEAWVLLSTLVDWRWLMGRADSPWYPTMRLFRQTDLGDWATPFGQIITEINRKVG